MADSVPDPSEAPPNFVAEEVRADLAATRFSRPIRTRFPPEPNGYMHLGHAKAAMVGFGIAREFDGICSLRLDDTNPVAERAEYAEAMIRDVAWLIAPQPLGTPLYASDYFDHLLACAIRMVEKGLAYVDDQSLAEIRDNRGDFHRPGTDSPYRDRPVAENLKLFGEMRDGGCPPGKRVLRAKIDMASPNMNLRDPLIYRVLDARHERAGKWHIYPLYDFAHPLSDAVEGVTHSTCGMEFENHRSLYDWFLAAVDTVEPPRQLEFAELRVTGTILAKRHLRALVDQGLVAGWDDPRMPTISGMRRRGIPAAAIREFCQSLGVSAGSPGTVDISHLEFFAREELNRTAPRVMCVLDPLEVVIESYPEDELEDVEVPNLPGDASYGTRKVPFSRTIYIDRSDFMENPPKKYFRLSPGKEVRLRSAYYITCTGIERDAQTGEIVRLRATHDPTSRGGQSADGRKVKGTLHWVSAKHAVPVMARLYDRLFLDSIDEFDGEGPLGDHINRESLEVATAVAEPSVGGLNAGDRVQFERVGYFIVDSAPAPAGAPPVFNQTLALRDKKFARIFK